MRDTDKKWMAYIDGEVRAACEEKGWGHQIRRKWAVREKPVSESPVDDYEWKLIPGAHGKLPDQMPSDFDEGTYYVLSFDCDGGRFVLQHDTAQCGIEGPHWNLRSYTEIHLLGVLGEYKYAEIVRQVRGTEHEGRIQDAPPKGWLRKYLIDLASRFKPNQFSAT